MRTGIPRVKPVGNLGQCAMRDAPGLGTPLSQLPGYAVSAKRTAHGPSRETKRAPLSQPRPDRYVATL